MFFFVHSQHHVSKLCSNRQNIPETIQPRPLFFTVTQARNSENTSTHTGCRMCHPPMIARVRSKDHRLTRGISTLSHHGLSGWLAIQGNIVFQAPRWFFFAKSVWDSGFGQNLRRVHGLGYGILPRPFRDEWTGSWRRRRRIRCNEGRRSVRTGGRLVLRRSVSIGGGASRSGK